MNAIYPTFAKELGLSIRPIDIGSLKINSTILDTYEMVVTAFSIMDKANRVKFLEETFLMANVIPEVVFRMFFLILSGIDIDFLDWELR